MALLVEIYILRLLIPVMSNDDPATQTDELLRTGLDKGPKQQRRCLRATERESHGMKEFVDPACSMVLQVKRWGDGDPLM